jgi:hypothetical protein
VIETRRASPGGFAFGACRAAKAEARAAIGTRRAGCCIASAICPRFSFQFDRFEAVRFTKGSFARHARAA